jgi:hypothetical protein
MHSESVEAAKQRALSRASTLSSLDKFYADQKKGRNSTSLPVKPSQPPTQNNGGASEMGRVDASGAGEDDMERMEEGDAGETFTMENSHGIVAVIKQYITSLKPSSGVSSSAQTHADARLTRTLSDQLINKAIILQNSAADSAKSANRIRK